MESFKADYEQKTSSLFYTRWSGHDKDNYSKRKNSCSHSSYKEFLNQIIYFLNINEINTYFFQETVVMKIFTAD